MNILDFWNFPPKNRFFRECFVLFGVFVKGIVIFNIGFGFVVFKSIWWHGLKICLDIFPSSSVVVVRRRRPSSSSVVVVVRRRPSSSSSSVGVVRRRRPSSVVRRPSSSKKIYKNMNCGTCRECKIKIWVFENFGFLKFSDFF